MTGRLHVLVVCALLCTVVAAPVVAQVSAPTAASNGYAQAEDPSDEPDPDIFVNTTSIDYGEVDIGETGSASVTIRNDGEGTLRIKDLELGGDDAFSLDLEDDSSSETDGEVATSPNFTLEPGESEQVPVIFEPTSDADYSGTLTIHSDDPETPLVDVALTGDGQQPSSPGVTVSSRSLTFEDATVGEQSVRNVTVTNTGEEELLVDEQSIQPADGDFEILTPLGDNISPGESDTLSVGFTPSTQAATSATLSLTTNAPNETTLIYLSSTRAGADVSLNRSENTTELTASVQNATAGEPVSISVPSDPDDPASTDIDSVSLTPARNGSFDLNVTSTTERPADASEFEANGSTQPDELGYMNVSHSIPNEDIDEATIQYRVNQSTMEELEAEPEDFTLYRYNGSWQPVNTTFDREANGSYMFTGTTTGLSEWTAATEVPRISVSDASANVTAITLEESVEIQVLLNNTGGSDGRFEVELIQNDTVVERRDVAVDPSTTSLVTFQRTFDQTGTYSIEVNDIFVAAVEVSEGEANVVGEQQAQETDVSSTGSGGPWGILAAGAVAVLTIVGLVGFGIYRVVGGSEPAVDDGAPGPATDAMDADETGAAAAAGADAVTDAGDGLSDEQADTVAGESEPTTDDEDVTDDGEGASDEPAEASETDTADEASTAEEGDNSESPSESEPDSEDQSTP